MEIETLKGEVTVMEVLQRMKVGLERSLEDEEMSVEFYRELKPEVSRLIEQIVNMVRSKVRALSEMVIEKGDVSGEASLGKLVQGMVEKIEEDPKGEHSGSHPPHRTVLTKLT
jgi:hypothetical protein